MLRLAGGLQTVRSASTARTPLHLSAVSRAKRSDSENLADACNVIDRSDAVARDWGALEDFDFSRRVRNLFSEVDREDEQQADFDHLVELVRPVLLQHPTLTGQKLALALYRQYQELEAVFGRYKESDYTKAAQVCRGSAHHG
jgi:hypothetical protein